MPKEPKPCTYKFNLEETNMNQTRYRHTVENDLKTATIKRINRWYAKQECDRCLKTGKDGITRLYVKSTGELRECFGPVDVDTFEKNFLLSA